MLKTDDRVIIRNVGDDVLKDATGTILGVSAIFAEVTFYIVQLDTPVTQKLPDRGEYLQRAVQMIGSCLEKIEKEEVE